MVMTVECPECGTSFPVDPGKVPSSGVRAQCSVCPGIFPVFPFETDADAWKGDLAAPGVAEPAPMEPVPEEPAPAEAAPVEPPPAEPAPVDVSSDWRTAGEPGSVEVVEPEPETWVEPDEAVELPEAVEPVHPEPSAPEPPSAQAPIQFGRRDPHDKARRLARVLVSDMIVYHREKHTQALEAGTLLEDFQDEVQKSWEEYVDQIGSELAESTPYFREALNEILAKGQEVF